MIRPRPNSGALFAHDQAWVMPPWRCPPWWSDPLRRPQLHDFPGAGALSLPKWKRANVAVPRTEGRNSIRATRWGHEQVGLTSVSCRHLALASTGTVTALDWPSDTAVPDFAGAQAGLACGPAEASPVFEIDKSNVIALW